MASEKGDNNTSSAVKFLRGSLAEYNAAEKTQTTFYLVDNKDLYLGNTKLSGSGDGIISSNKTVENIVTLTVDEYKALETKENNTLYNITDDMGGISGGGVSTVDTGLTCILPVF